MNSLKNYFTSRFPFTSHQGFTLVEIIITLFILVAVIVPILNAYSPAVFATSTEEETAVFMNQARGTLNRVAACDFRALNELVQSGQANPVNLTSLFGTGEETFSFRGTNYVPTVVITDQGGMQGGLLEITVSINYLNLKTLKAEY